MSVPEITPTVYVRHGGKCSLYGDTIITTYEELLNLYNILKQYDLPTKETGVLEEIIEQKSKIVIVFSALCLESYFNQYASVVLGDDVFYNSFDCLSPIAKFELIVNFIFKQKVDKGASPYGPLKQLISRRNNLVHDKSKEYKAPLDIEIIDEANRINTQKPYLHVKNQFQSAQEALYTVRDIANYFDEHDGTAYAINSIFYTQTAHLFYDEDFISSKKKFLHGLGIKFVEAKETKGAPHDPT